MPPESAIVVRVEQSQTTYPDLGGRRSSLVSILHGSSPRGSPKIWRTEDVIKFRKVPSHAMT